MKKKSGTSNETASMKKGNNLKTLRYKIILEKVANENELN